MTTRDYTVLLEGVEALDLSLGVLRDLCDLFTEGAQRSARLVAEGRSVARGVLPAWASAAADIRLFKFENGSLDLGVRAARLVDVAPDIFAPQQLLPAGTDPDATAFDCFSMLQTTPLPVDETASGWTRESWRCSHGPGPCSQKAGLGSLCREQASQPRYSTRQWLNSSRS